MYEPFVHQSVATVSHSEPISPVHTSVDPRFSKLFMRASDYQNRISQQQSSSTSWIHSPSVLMTNSKAWLPTETSGEKLITVPKESCSLSSWKFRLQGLLVGLAIAAIATGITLGVLLTRPTANNASAGSSAATCSSFTWDPTPVVVAGNGAYGNDSYTLAYPWGLYVDTDNALYVADSNNERVQKFLPNSLAGITVAGVTSVSGYNNSLLSYPRTVFVYLQQYLYVGDNYGVSVWILGTANSSRITSTIGYGSINSLYVDNNENIYTSSFSCEIRMWPANGANSLIVAGGNTCGYSLTQLYGSTGFTVDSSTNTIYIANTDAQTIMAWSIGASQGSIIAGQNMTSGFNDSLLYYPQDVKQDQYGNLYVADSDNDRVLLLCQNPSSTSGRTIASYQIFYSRSIALDSDLNLYVLSPYYNRVLKYNRIS